MYRASFLLVATVLLFSGVVGSSRAQDPVMPLNEEFNIVLTTGADNVVYYRFNVTAPAVNTGNVVFFHVGCSNAASAADFGASFNFGSRPATGSTLQGVQSTEYTIDGSLIKEYAIPKDLVQTGQWFVAIQNSATVQLNCVGFAFVAPEVTAALATNIELTLHPPAWTILAVDLPTAQVMSVVIRDLRADTGSTVRMITSAGKYPFSNTPEVQGSRSTGKMTARTEYQIPAPEIAAGRNYIALFVNYNGFVQPSVPVILSIAAANITPLSTGKTVSSTLQPLQENYFTINIPYESSALMLRFTANDVFTPAPQLALDGFPNYANTLIAPTEVFEEYDDSNPAEIQYYAIIQSDKLTIGDWGIRVLNTQADSGNILTYTLKPTVAVEAPVRVGEQLAIVINPGEAGLFSLVSSGNTNLFYVTIVANQEVVLKLRQHDPPTSSNSLAVNVTTDVTGSETGKFYHHYVYQTDDSTADAGNWFGLIEPANATTDQPVELTLSFTGSWQATLSDFSLLGGRIDPYGADYYQANIMPDVGRGLYIKVESSGAIPRLLIQKERLPTELSFIPLEDGIIDSYFQLSWNPISAISELYIPEANLTAGTWFIQVAARLDPSRRMSYALTSVLFDTVAITTAGTALPFSLSENKMLIITYDHVEGSKDISISITPGDKLDVIAKLNEIPSTFDNEQSGKLSVNAGAVDNTMTYTIPNAAIGKWYFRVSADTFVKNIQATIHVGNFITPVSNGLEPTPTNILAWILIPLAIIFIILGIVVLILFLRKRKAIANADLEYQLLGREKAEQPAAPAASGSGIVLDN